MLTTSHLVDVSRRNLSWFLKQNSETKYRQNGILPSEMLCFCSLAREQGHQEVIESGRKNGFSTEALMRCGFKTISYEVEPISNTTQRLAEICVSETLDLNMHTGDFAQHASELSDIYRCPMLIDGPKGRKAVQIVQNNLDHLPFAAIHDMSRQAEGRVPNTGRVALEECGLEFVILGDEFAEEFGLLDRGAWESDYNSREEMTRFGFHMAIIRGKLWRD